MVRVPARATRAPPTSLEPLEHRGRLAAEHDLARVDDGVARIPCEGDAQLAGVCPEGPRLGREVDDDEMIPAVHDDGLRLAVIVDVHEVEPRIAQVGALAAQPR